MIFIGGEIQVEEWLLGKEKIKFLILIPLYRPGGIGIFFLWRSKAILNEKNI